MQAQTEPHTSPFLSSSAFTRAGSMCDGSSTGISTVSKPHFLKVGKNLVLSFVKGEVNKKVLMPSLIMRGREANQTHLPVKGISNPIGLPLHFQPGLGLDLIIGVAKSCN